MLKQLDEFLVTHTPRIWRSRLVLMVLISAVLSLTFSQFKGSQLISSDTEMTLVMGIILIGVYWVFLQFRHQPFLRRFSIWEILLGSLLNFFCLALLIVPFHFLYESYYDSYGFENGIDGIVVVAYYLFLPMAFLPFVIRNFSISEIVLTIVFIIVFGIISVILIDMVSEYSNFDFRFAVFSIVIFLGILIYTLTALFSRRYGQGVKRTALLVILTTPFVIAFSGAIMSGDASNWVPNVNVDEHLSLFLNCFAATFIALLIFTWYLTRSLEKPMVVR